MKYEESIKKSLVLIIMILALAIGLTMIVSMVMQTNMSDTASPQSDTNQSKVTKADIPQDKLPNKFPEDMPIESGAVITQNFSAFGEDGSYQATRAFETTKSLAENMTIFRQYMTKNGWEIKSSVDNPTLKSVVAAKGTQRLSVSASDNPATKVKTVTITVTELP